MMSFEGIDLLVKDIYFAKKLGVEHAFAITNNAMVNNFLNYNFLSWEDATFLTFDMIKDPNGIALDIGSWIGTTGIWLSKNFSNVICVEADNESIAHLKVNLKLSNCKNALICEAPISSDCSNLIFGPRNNGEAWNILNHSTSHLKSVSNSVHDYTKKCVTLKKILYDYVYDLNKKLTFIKCDIEGGEDSILEDILQYCLHNDCSCYISFHLNWWRPKYCLDKFSEYFKCFDCFELKKCIDDPLKQIKLDPFGSFLFKRKQGVNPNEISRINQSILITSYKNLEELEKIVNEIKKFTNDIIILSSEDVEDRFPYFIIKESNEKSTNFINYLKNTGSIEFDSTKISSLLENPEDLEKRLEELLKTKIN